MGLCHGDIDLLLTGSKTGNEKRRQTTSYALQLSHPQALKVGFSATQLWHSGIKSRHTLSARHNS